MARKRTRLNPRLWANEESPQKTQKEPPPKVDDPLFAVLRIGAIAYLLLAVFHWPYEYYMQLRWVSSLACLNIGALAREARQSCWLIGAILFGVVYNPILPVHLNRPIWFVLNLALAAFIYAAGGRCDARRDEEL